MSVPGDSTAHVASTGEPTAGAGGSEKGHEGRPWVCLCEIPQTPRELITTRAAGKGRVWADLSGASDSERASRFPVLIKKIAALAKHEDVAK